MTLAAPVPVRPRRLWLFVGLALLAYAALGNWLVLPGYRRFLEHGSGGAGGPALIWGAVRTILWMLSFHLGAFCVAAAALAASPEPSPAFRRWFAAGALLWIVLWSIPALPGPYAAFFAGTGLLILLFVGVAFARAALTGQPFAGARGGHWRIAAAFFFALATWDMCGLGSVGGILHPADTARMASQGLVVAQTTKLIVELAIAWGLMAVAATPGKRPSRA